MDNSRREFVRLLVYFGAGAAVAGCGKDAADTPPATPDCSAYGGKATTISGNHGHLLMVPVADFAAGDHIYSIMGSAGHDHQITLTAADLVSVMAGNMVQTTSTDSQLPVLHHHVVTVGCAAAAAGGGGGGGYDPYP